MPSREVLIVGGGLSGSVTALHLARAGIPVHIFDRKSFPREKPCGEGMMPHGVRMLSELGILQRLPLEDRRNIRGVEYVVEGNVRARGEFHEIEGGWKLGIGIRRLKLDEVVLEMARAHPNITVHEQVRVDQVLVEDGRAIGLRTREGDFEGAVVVGADGRGSLVRKQLGLDRVASRYPRWGIRAHFGFKNGERIGDFVEVYKEPAGEAYLTPVTQNEMCVALLFNKSEMDRFGGRLEEGFRAYIDSVPALRDRFQDAELVSTVMACGPLASASTRPFSRGALLVGDAAGFLDPLNPEGMSLAMSTAKEAARVITASLATGSEASLALDAYGPAWSRATRHYYLMTWPWLYLSRSLPMSRWVVRRLSRSPGMFQMLMAFHSGEFRLRDVNLMALSRFIVGV